MPTPRILVLRAPGTNCDEETAYAFDLAGGKSDRVHINRLLENPKQLADYQVLCIPGGFCYGDDLGAGKILASQIQFRLRDVFEEFKRHEKLILGICNGFQVLIKSGILLENGPDGSAPATLTWNDSARYEDRWVRLVATPSPCVFFRAVESMELPVAHGEGKFVARDESVLQKLAAAGQLPLRYTYLSDGAAAKNIDTFVPYPDNPNGAQLNVAAACDTTGRVCGLMPHPERHIDYTQHPNWTRRKEQPPHGDGLVVFRNAVGYFA